MTVRAGKLRRIDSEFNYATGKICRSIVTHTDRSLGTRTVEKKPPTQMHA
jgi:hypothetical protein